MTRPTRSRNLRARLVWAASLLPLAAAPGCGGPPPAAPKPPPPLVLYSVPVTREVHDFEEFTGYTAAVKTNEIRARVSGYLDSVKFDDGAEVGENVLLFEIDPRQYQAEVDRTEAAVAQSEAHTKTAEANFNRANDNYNRKVISRAEMDQASGDYSESRAMVGVAKANRDLARLNLSFTKVYSPIAGRLSRRMVDPGNLVRADDTMLTTIVALDPMYVYFDIDERVVLKIRRMIQEGKMKSRTEAEVAVMAALADEEKFTHRGTMDFSENRVDSSTGTLRVRAKMPNPKPEGTNTRVLSPGLFMRLQLPIGMPRKALMVPEQALGTDQGRKFLYTLNAKNEVVYLPVTTGTLNEGYRVIEDAKNGLKPGDRVIVSGLQRVRPGLEVNPKPAPAQSLPAPPQSVAGDAPAATSPPSRG